VTTQRSVPPAPKLFEPLPASPQAPVEVIPTKQFNNLNDYASSSYSNKPTVTQSSLTSAATWESWKQRRTSKITIISTIQLHNDSILQ